MIPSYLPRPVAIVTGASAGIGKATVQRLLAEGYDVHAAARRVEAMRDLEQAGAHVHHLDLTKPASLDAFAAAVLAHGARVDVLVNNAGYGAYGAIEDVPLDLARAQMEVNLFGLARLIQLVLPAMRQQRAGRIVNVTSIGGKLWSPMGGWYHASKYAVEGLSDCLRNELRPFGIDVVLIEPGGVKTEWGAVTLDHLRRTSGAGAYRAFAERAGELAARFSNAGAEPRVIADVIWRAVSARRPKARYVAPFSARVMLRMYWALSDGLFDRLWARVFGLPARLSPTGERVSG